MGSELFGLTFYCSMWNATTLILYSFGDVPEVHNIQPVQLPSRFEYNGIQCKQLKLGWFLNLTLRDFFVSCGVHNAVVNTIDEDQQQCNDLLFTSRLICPTIFTS